MVNLAAAQAPRGKEVGGECAGAGGKCEAELHRRRSSTGDAVGRGGRGRPAPSVPVRPSKGEPEGIVSCMLMEEETSGKGREG